MCHGLRSAGRALISEVTHDSGFVKRLAVERAWSLWFVPPEGVAEEESAAAASNDSLRRSPAIRAPGWIENGGDSFDLH